METKANNLNDNLKENHTLKNDKHISVKTNYAFNLIVQIITYIAPIITAPYISRVLLPKGVGEYSYAHSIVSYFILFISFGFLNFGNNTISKQREDKKIYSNTFWSIFFARFILFLLASGVYLALVFCNVFGSSDERNLYLFLGLFIVAAFVDIAYLFQGLEDFRIISIIQVLCKIISVICVFLFVKSQDDLIYYALINGGYSLAVAVISWTFAVRRIEKPSFRELHVWKSLKEAFPFFVPTVAISIYTMVDRTMLGALAGQVETGYYEQASKIYTMTGSLISALFPVMLSRLSLLYKQQKIDEVRKKITQLGEIHGLISFPCVFGLYAVSRYFFPAFFGTDFLPSVNVMYVLAPIVLISSISGALFNAYFIPTGKINLSTIIYFFGAVVNLITNIFAIKAWGAVGAAVTSLISELLISSIMIFLTKKHVDYRKILVNDIKPLVASLVMFGIVMVLNYFVLDKFMSNVIYKTIISVVTGVAIYGAMVLILREPLVVQTLQSIKKRIHH